MGRAERWLHGLVLLVAVAVAGMLGACLVPFVTDWHRGHTWRGLHKFHRRGAFVCLPFLVSAGKRAAGQLLPLWPTPGNQTEWHERSRNRLTFAAAMRAVLFLVAGMLAIVCLKWASVLALAALLPFVVMAFSLLREARDS